MLSVLDGAVQLITAIEGVQSQTRILMRALQRLCIPTLIFVNKIDCGGARYQGVLKDISEKLTSQIVAMGSIRDSGTRDTGFTPFDDIDAAFTSRLMELLANNDDEILEAYVDDEASLPPIFAVPDEWALVWEELDEDDDLANRVWKDPEGWSSDYLINQPEVVRGDYLLNLLKQYSKLE